MTATERLDKAWSDVRGQWAANARLRWGVLGIVAILWVYALLLMGDRVQADQAANASLRDEIARTVPLSRERAWPARADDARKQADTLRAMLWTESDIGLSEASFQDWLRTTSSRTGLVVRELSVARAPDAAASSGAASAPASAAPPRRINAHLGVEFARLPLLAFLAEAARNDKVVVVDRLLLRLSSQPPAADIDLHVLAASAAAPAR